MNNHIKKIEKATQSAEYQTYAAMAGAALAGAILSPDKTARDAAVKQYIELQQKQAGVVRSACAA